MIGDISSSFRDAKVVVTAEAVSVSTAMAKTSATSPETGYEGEIQAVEWEVREAFKGPHEPTTRFTTSTEVACCTCGMSVTQGQTYVLYLHGKEPYGLSDCSGSSLLKNAQESIPDLKRLSRRSRNGT